MHSCLVYQIPYLVYFCSDSTSMWYVWRVAFTLWPKVSISTIQIVRKKNSASSSFTLEANVHRTSLSKMRTWRCSLTKATISQRKFGLDNNEYPNYIWSTSWWFQHRLDELFTTRVHFGQCLTTHKLLALAKQSDHEVPVGS